MTRQACRLLGAARCTSIISFYAVSTGQAVAQTVVSACPQSVQLLCNAPKILRIKSPVGVPGHNSPGLKQLGRIVSSSLLRPPLFFFRCANGLANSRFHTLLFGINRLRSDELPYCWAKSHCSGAIVQLLCTRISAIYHADLRPSPARTLERLADSERPRSGQSSQYKR